MATFKRFKKDQSLWFSDIHDSDGRVLQQLNSLKSEQAVELRVSDQIGVWVRFKGQPGKVPPALKRANKEAKVIWKAVSSGDSFSIDVVRILSVEESKPFSSLRSQRIELVPIESRIDSNILCIGVDVAWWGGGGGKSDHKSRMETIAFASRIEGVWGDIELKQVDLNGSYNKDADSHTPNSDPNADLLIQGIKSVLDYHKEVDQVVLALDMPVLAIDDGMKPPKKAYRKGEKGGEYRQCDRTWLKGKEASPAGWRSVNILTGAPIAPRIKALMSHLENVGFAIFGKANNSGRKIVIECFPNEILWSVGILGLAEGYTFKTLQLYKSIGKYKTPLAKQVFDSVWRLPTELALRVAGLPQKTIDLWQKTLAEWLVQNDVFNDSTKIGQTGKQFDDAIDSVLSLAAVVAFVEGRAHIHQGADPNDGHIIGPGLSIED